MVHSANNKNYSCCHHSYSIYFGHIDCCSYFANTNYHSPSCIVNIADQNYFSHFSRENNQNLNSPNHPNGEQKRQSKVCHPF